MTVQSIVDPQDRLHSEMLRIWSRLLESSDLSIDDDFFDKGGDSLLATELMLELQQFAGGPLPNSLLFESSTVRSLAERLSAKEPPRAKAAVRIGAASDGAKPLLFFHGDWTSGGFYVEHLARKLGPDFSLIAVAPHGAGGEPIPASIEAMAADRLPAILEAQPTGPYRLAGHCVGGIVALETARLLMRLDHQVEAVVMIDSPLIVGGTPSRIPQGDSGRPDAAAHDPAIDDTPIEPTSPGFDWGMEHYQKRLAAYSPIPLPVRLCVFASEYDGRDWVRLSGEAELIEIPGGHFDWVTFRINDLARNLRSWLSGNALLGLTERCALTPSGNDQTSPAGSRNPESPQSLGRQNEDKARASGFGGKNIPAPPGRATISELLSHGLRWISNYARRGDRYRYSTKKL
jgi:pimeloyl-ACP methyl ester carboxylesterase